jgi:NCAIR mutase (PurE)-related protein
MKKNLRKVLEDLKNSKLDIDSALELIQQNQNTIELGYASLDIHRENRTNIPEIIFCENKSTDKILKIIKSILSEKELVIGSRCSEEKLKLIKKKYPKGTYSFEGKAFFIGKSKEKIYGKVGIISAGTTDVPVCEEAAILLQALGVDFERFYDIGVAGLHRLLSKVDKIKSCDVLIVAAGMEGALPSVVGGVFPQPIIAVPTSIGYGTSLNGFTALFAMLTSCSPGITVVNINNGIGAASAAIKILKLLDSKLRKE